MRVGKCRRSGDCDQMGIPVSVVVVRVVPLRCGRRDPFLLHQLFFSPHTYHTDDRMFAKSVQNFNTAAFVPPEIWFTFIPAGGPTALIHTEISTTAAAMQQ